MQSLISLVFFFPFQGQKTEAEKYYLRAIQLDPTKGNCYMHYGESRKQKLSPLAVLDLVLQMVQTHSHTHTNMHTQTRGHAMFIS